MIIGEIVRTMCCAVYYSGAQRYAYTYEQLLRLTVGLGLGLLLYVLPVCSRVVFFCCVGFIFFITGREERLRNAVSARLQRPSLRDVTESRWWMVVFPVGLVPEVDRPVAGHRRTSCRCVY